MRRPVAIASPSVPDREWMARSVAILYGSGALIGTLTYFFPAPEGTRSLALLLNSFIGYPIALIVLLLSNRLTDGHYHALALLGTIDISAALFLAGPTALGASMTLIYVWVPLWICYVFPLWQGLLHVLAIAVFSGIALITIHGDVGITIWLSVVGTNIVAAVIVGILARINRTLARIDTLTGAFNRLEWDEAVEREIKRAERFGYDVCLVFLDLDHFKSINDTLGHAAGDQMLQELSLAAKRQLRREDIFARVGGDEFALLLPNCPLSQATVIVSRLSENLPEGCTLSAGIASRLHQEGGDALKHRADQALYSAKKAGRNTWRVAA